MIKRFIGILALGVSLSASAETPNITGTWNMGLQGGHVIPVALVLKQDGKALTGTITLPRQSPGQRDEVALTGEIADGAFTLSGAVEHDSGGVKLEIAGKTLEDGTLEGTVSMPGHLEKMQWTAERLKERKK